MSALRIKLIRLAHANPELRAELLPLLKEAAPALAVGKTIETPHLRIHRYMDSIRIWDLTYAGKRGKNVDILAVTDIDYLKRNDLAMAKFERWLKGAVKGDTFSETVRGLDGLLSDLARTESALPKKYLSKEKGVRIDPPQSVMKQIKDLKIFDTPKRTIVINAKPSDVSIREVIFVVDDETGQRGLYLHDNSVGNLRTRRDTRTLYNWVIKNLGKLKQVKNLAEVKGMLNREGVPYDTYYLD